MPDFNNLAPSKQGSKSSDIPIESSIKLLYSGNMGSSHELSAVLDSLHTLLSETVNYLYLHLAIIKLNYLQNIPILLALELILKDFQSDEVYSHQLISSTSDWFP